MPYRRRAMMNKYLDDIEKYLEQLMPDENCCEENVVKAIRYSVLAEGKRVRPTLVLAFCEAFGGDVEAALPYACAIEMIHAYSLIHDDLPCMDNDDLRRGRPSNHKVFGEDIALLAGDALQSLAFESMLSPSALEKTGSNGARAAHILACECGVHGMVGGQVIDLETEGKDPSVEIISEMYSKKTGALIRAACTMGAVLAGADNRAVSLARTYAENIGLAFQIVDDILDIESDTQTLGKPVGSDAENEKVNYVTKVGVDSGRELVEKLTSNALKVLDEISADTDFLRDFAVSLSHRLK